MNAWRATCTCVLFRTRLCMHVFFVSYCAYFRVLCMFDLVAQLRAPATLEGGIIKGVSGYKTAHSSARTSFVCPFVRLHSSFTPSCVLVRDFI